MDWKSPIKSSWDNVCQKVNKSIVFMDDACAQNLHWNGGAMLLFNAGALNIKEFSSFEVGGAVNSSSSNSYGIFYMSKQRIGILAD